MLEEIDARDRPLEDRESRLGNVAQRRSASAPRRPVSSAAEVASGYMARPQVEVTVC